MIPRQARPIVSVILPVRNEAQFIAQTIGSLLDQDSRDFELELLVVDGMSTDGSAGIVGEMAREDPRIRLLVNQRIKTPYAFNLGLREARGQYVCILGAHNTYARDYIAVCLRDLTASGSAACSGRVISQPPGKGLSARLACWTMGHRFGSSGKSFRTQVEGYVDTVPYPVMLKSAVLEAGGYDECLSRNQDNDLNQKLRAAGHKLFCTGKTHCVYHTQPTVKALLKYAFRNGYWNVISFRRNPSSMALRHFVPLFFVFAMLLSALVALGSAWLPGGFRPIALLPLAVLAGLHLVAGCLAAVDVAVREKDLRGLCLPPVFFAFHASYGFGSLWALLTNAHPQLVQDAAS